MREDEERMNAMSMDDQVKLSRFYESDKMAKYVRFMELFAEIMQDPNTTPDNAKRAKMLFEHYRRMVLNMAIKEIPTDFRTNDVLGIRDVMSMLTPMVVKTESEAQNG